MLNLLTDVTTIDMLDHLYEAGRDEDGGLVYGHVFIIIAETPDGHRFELDTRFSDNTRVIAHGDGYSYTSDATAESRALAIVEKIQKFIDLGMNLSRDHWTPRQGCYGSAGWSERDELALEVREAVAAGESVPSHLLALA